MAFVLILVFSTIGLVVSWLIFYQKRKESGQLVCVVGKDCNTVVHSKYNQLFGIQLEILGMLYYLFIFLLALGLLFGYEAIAGFPLAFILLVASCAGALFSLYFIYIQGFVLHAWCEYCLTSAFASFAIFLTEILVIVGVFGV